MTATKPTAKETKHKQMKAIKTAYDKAKSEGKVKTVTVKVNNTKPKFDTSAFVFSYPIEDIKAWLDAFDESCEDVNTDWPSQDECSVYCQLRKDYLTAVSEGDTAMLLNAIESRVTGLYNGKKKKGVRK